MPDTSYIGTCFVFMQLQMFYVQLQYVGVNWILKYILFCILQFHNKRLIQEKSRLGSFIEDLVVSYLSIFSWERNSRAEYLCRGLDTMTKQGCRLKQSAIPTLIPICLEFQLFCLSIGKGVHNYNTCVSETTHKTNAPNFICFPSYKQVTNWGA